MALKPCPHCGNHISDKATKCPKCGAEISGKSFSEDTKYVKENEQPIDTSELNETSRSRSNLWIMIILAIIVIGLIAGGIIYLNSDKSIRDEKITVERKHKNHQAYDNEALNENESYEALMIAQQQRQDSLAAVQKEAERLEAERQEQLRQDSIKAVKERIENATLHWNDVLKYDSSDGYWVLNDKVIKSNLLKKGFEQTDHHREYITDTSWGDFWEETWTYTFFKDKNKKSGKLYEVIVYNNECYIILKIYDSNLLLSLRKELDGRNLSLMPGGGIDIWKQVFYDGNTIIISFCGD